ncbi:SRPBCC family protein [Angustibacter luteus]|uniref:Carbon monoxide dehydrogenase subunit G n=1 Tax=Angustibacter luteus TaxID=658456 RepID=A0ABW1JAG7_9ACTN
MKVNGSAVLHAERQRVYDALNDPAVLGGAIPGCQSLVALGEDRYRMSVTAGVASIKGTYDGEVQLSDQRAPGSFTMRAKGSGAPGTVDATCRVTLTEGDDGTTTLEYDADAVVGGVVGGVGQRMLTGVAKKMAGQFFGNVDDVLTGRRPAVTTEAASEASRPLAGTTRPAPAGPAQSRTSPLAAALVGAAIALAGVALGWAIARGR